MTRECYICDDEYVEVFPFYAPPVPLCHACSGTDQTLLLLIAAKAEASSRYLCYVCAERFEKSLSWLHGDYRLCLACVSRLAEGPCTS